ncbi:MAG: porin family protein [Bacteroidales bacterium]|nr:porin family protein [Bacteroidales bacterium]
MKKTISALIIAFLFSSVSLMAQKQLYFGLAGTGLSSIVTNQNNYGLWFEMDYKVTFGGSGNVTAGFDFNKHAGLKLEIGFAKLGQKYADHTKGPNDSVYSDYTRNVKLNYLQIPLLFKYRTGGEVVRFYLMAGPQFNFLLSATQQYLKDDEIFDIKDYKPENWDKMSIQIGQEKITERYSSLDIMGRLDLGTDIQVASNLFLNVGLTLAYGLLDINGADWHIKDHTGNYNPSHNIYGGLNFGINYVLPLGSK